MDCAFRGQSALRQVMFFFVSSRGRRWAICLPLALALCALAIPLRATSIIPITDQELHRRADVVVHGIVVSSDVTVDDVGRPETLTVIEPLSVLKGQLSGSLILHQLGGTLPDGRFLKLWGRPEYLPGREVIVFAIARPEGDYQTAEMLLGKFEVWRDEAGNQFAMPDLATGVHPGVEVYDRESFEPQLPDRLPGVQKGSDLLRRRADGDTKRPRSLMSFLKLARIGLYDGQVFGTPVGKLEPVNHAEIRSGKATPLWGNLSDILYRWNNGATAVWTLEGMANMTGGGISEATNALAVWSTYPNATINYTVGSGTSNLVHLNAASSPCGWSTCLPPPLGVIGCGGPSGISGVNVWRGDTYSTIAGGEVWLRCYSSFNQVSSTTTQSVLEHEHGHTLGLGHSDTNVSPHDVCRGDEGLAIMFSSAQNRTTLGTDDQDAIRWIYGDGGNSCTSQPPTVTSISPTFGATAGGTLVTVSGTNFVTGASLSIGGVAATGVTVVSSTTITGTTGPHAAGVVDVVVTNPDTLTGTLAGGFTYSTGAAFFTVTPCRLVDTRNPPGPSGGPALSANSGRTFPVSGLCSIPGTAKAVALILVAVAPSDSGDIRLYPAGGAAPLTSAINFRLGLTRANNAVIPLGTGGQISAFCDMPVGSTGSTHFVIDAYGYFQ